MHICLYANNDNNVAEQLEDTGGHSRCRVVELVNRERVTLLTTIVSNLAKLEQA